MRNPIYLAVAVALLLPATPRAQQNQQTARLVDRYTAGVEAEKRGDCAAYGDHMKQALALAPGHPALLRHVARALACQGRADAAVEMLRRAVATGADLAIGDDAYFESLRERDDFQRLLQEVEAHKQPLGHADVVFRLDVGDLLPEGIAYDPGDDVFYLGSVRHGKILRVSRTGRCTDFAALEGMWAVSAHMPGVAGYSAERDGDAEVFRFDLDNGALLGRHTLTNDDASHNLNDVVVSSNGTAYITDSFTGAIYTIDPQRNLLETLLAPHATAAPNGLALSADEKLLYIAQYGIDIAVFDLERNTVAPLRCPDDVVVCGVDGLYVHRGTLIGVQNFLGLQQVAQFYLNESGDAIVGARVLVRHDPHLDDPTTGALVGDDFFFVANSQLPRVGAGGSVPPGDTFDDTFILRVRVE
jgi:hypothetical protein